MLTAEASAQGACAGIDLEKTQQEIHDGKIEGIETFRKNPECFGWPIFYLVAKQLFLMGERDEAVKWFYVGQLRGRVSATFDSDESASKALISSLNEVVGPTINGYAGHDLRNWISIINEVLAWDKAHPLMMDQTQARDPQQFNTTYQKVRDGLLSMRTQLETTDPAECKKKRKANGLD